ncbi:uncharacterized protein (TIGR03085 family) [Thermocatellispora tengchongensis]|uniref:Uncharacterized protein (TIGR03085 family) n=1 Tax=Thermocatellispora tengchongensis TaxID=1073253 RepID=A0A840NYB0_9ACTN|nr:TIGR03085 family metal-binding protein [Thermocatellispora tengchongensis]MBB5131759.1 uncharacterized protein (TIGR03085 family) [Thermocatellispora tengchongensis]
MSHARAERAAISDLFERLGPDAPTLCAGWTAFDLAAHLVLRERRPAAAGGIALPALAGYTAGVQRALKERHGFEGLVRLVRSGPGGFYRLIPGMDEAVNTLEYFVHHEDLRRAQEGWAPRELPPDLDNVIWKRLSAGARFMLRRSPVGVVLHRIGAPEGAQGRAVALGGPKGGPRVEVTGTAGELLLFCFGRQEHARVELTGDPGAVARLKEAPLGV